MSLVHCRHERNGKECCTGMRSGSALYCSSNKPKLLTGISWARVVSYLMWEQKKGERSGKELEKMVVG